MLTCTQKLRENYYSLKIYLQKGKKNLFWVGRPAHNPLKNNLS